MITGLLMLAAALGLAFNNVQPHLTTPAELARFTKCKPEAISYYERARFTGPLGAEWKPATACMKEENNDCKCFSRVAKDTLDVCKIPAFIVVVKDGTHAVVAFGHGRVMDNGEIKK